ncbi:hypothetical protein Tco_0098527 [Tanacetum coccineum]
MAALKLASSHNMVAFLDKSAESDGFEQIVDFLNAHPIKYALTVNPTNYTSCIEQFWTTTKVKTVNGEVQIQALVDKKKAIITETSIRRDLQLADENGTECLPNATIFEELERLGYENLTQKLTFYKAFFSPQWKFLTHTILQCLSAKTTSWNEFSSTMARCQCPCPPNKKYNFPMFLDKQVEGMSKHKKIYVTPSHTKKVFANMKRQGKDFSGRDTPLFPTMIVPAQEQVGEELVTNDTENVASVHTHSNDPLLSGEDRLKLNELMELCASLSQRVLDLENTKISQATEITELKKRVKKLEGKRKLSGGLMRKGGGRKKCLIHGILDGEEEFAEQDKEVAQKLQAQIDDELEEEEKLARQKEEDANIAKWDNAKDKGKAKMVEPEKPLKKKDQIMFDKEDNVQAIMDADYDLAARLQAEEQGELTIEEKSRLFVELMDKRKKHFSRLKAEEQRRKPSTKAQKRNTMSTYLKNIAENKHNQLKTKSFEDIQMLFDNEMKRVNTFVDMDTELVKGSETRTEGSSKRAGEELKSENLKKRKLDKNVEAEVDDEAEMKKHMEIVSNDEVAIDVIPLATKPPIIVDWKIIKEGKIGYFQIIRADGSSKRKLSMEESTMTQSDSLEAIFFKWSTFCEISESVYIYAGGEKYPLTPATIIEMLNKKLQADHWNEMCYQLLKLMTKHLKNPGSVSSVAGIKVNVLVTTAERKQLSLEEFYCHKDKDKERNKDEIVIMDYYRLL